MLSTLDISLYAVGAVILLVWVIVFLKGLKYAGLFESLEEKDFPLKEIYFLGYEILQTTKYGFRTKHDRKLRKELTVLYGDKYADYYLRVIHSQKITISFTILAIAVPFYGFSNSLSATIIIVAFSALAFYYFGTVAEKKILKRSEEILCDFPNVVSKLALLTNAGMIIRDAWKEVAYTGDSILYKEMQKTIADMDNGISDIDAFFAFGSRCVIPEIKKFTSTIIQGIIKGNSELAMMLQAQSKEVWAVKKQNVRRQGEKAASKLLIPIFIMFFGILIMIVVPIFTNLGA